jgi:hypothetical protein
MDAVRSLRASTDPGPNLVAGVPSFELVFRPSVQLISLVRRFVEDFYQNVLADDAAASRLALATHELLENAAKYSTDGSASLYVEVDTTGGAVLVRTTNRATTEQIDRLRAAFAEIEAARDVDSLYAETIRRTALLERGSGGIGLARILAEGDMAMELCVEEDRVAIGARGVITAAG